MPQTAQEIYQQVLDELTDGVMAHDYDQVRYRLALPHLMVTSTARMEMTTEAELRELVTTFSHSLRELNVTDYRRVAHECEFVTDTVISGHHTSHLLRDGVEILPSYPSMWLLEHRDGRWMVIEAQNAIENDQWPILMPEVACPSARDEPDPRTRLTIVQTLMDRISHAFMQGDVEEWLACIELPFALISSHGPDRFETADAVRADFEVYQHEIRLNGVTDIIRTVLGSHMAGGDRMVGIYRTHILRGTEQLVPAWNAAVTMRLTDNTWRATSVLRAIGHHNWSAASAADIQNISKTPRKLGERLQ